MKRSNITLSDIARWQKQGRGRGEGKNYKPWLRVRDIPSRGRSSRIKGLKTHRVHHLLSDLETNHFLHLDFNPSVIDIREQFPLFPLEELISIACKLGIRYPRYLGTTTPYVLTTDFLVTYRNENGENRYIARTIKYEEELKSPRVLEKLEIERVFWQLRGVDWQIGTEDLNRTLVANLNWLRPHLHLVNISASDQKLPKFYEVFMNRLNNKETLKDLIRAATVDAKLQYQEGILYFRYLAWHRFIDLDLENFQLHLMAPLPLVIRSNSMESTDIQKRMIA